MMFSLLLLLVLVIAANAFHFNGISIRQSSLRLNMAAEKKEALTKSELLDILKLKTGLLKKDAETILDAFTSTIKEEVLDNGKEVRIRDLGIFKLKTSTARVGRNPRTGEELQIAGGKSVSFSVSSALKVKNASDADAPVKKAAALKKAVTATPAVKKTAK